MNSAAPDQAEKGSSKLLELRMILEIIASRFARLSSIVAITIEREARRARNPEITFFQAWNEKGLNDAKER